VAARNFRRIITVIAVLVSLSIGAVLPSKSNALTYDYTYLGNYFTYANGNPAYGAFSTYMNLYLNLRSSSILAEGRHYLSDFTSLYTGVGNRSFIEEDIRYNPNFFLTNGSYLELGYLTQGGPLAVTAWNFYLNEGVKTVISKNYSESSFHGDYVSMSALNYYADNENPGYWCAVTQPPVHIPDPPIKETLPEPVPEPSTFALLGVGLAGVGFLRRRIKK
jgi:hypothetical protein